MNKYKSIYKFVYMFFFFSVFIWGKVCNSGLELPFLFVMGFTSAMDKLNGIMWHSLFHVCQNKCHKLHNIQPLYNIAKTYVFLSVTLAKTLAQTLVISKRQLMGH